MFVAWRDLRFAKGRFALMGTVVVLMTLLVGLLSGLTAGLGRDSTSAITGLPADHLAFAEPASGQTPSFTESSVEEPVWQQWAGTPGVENADPLGISRGKATVGQRTASASVFGTAPGASLAPRAERIAPGAAVLSTGAAEELDAHRGEAVTLNGRELRVAAVSGDASYSHTPVIWTSLADWQDMSPGRSGEHATVVALSTSGDVPLGEVDEQLGTRTMSRSESLSAISSYSSENASLQMMRGFLFAIAALVVGAFFTVWTIQRSRDIAVLKALGARTGYLLRDALGQALVLLVGGTAAGTALAAGIGALAAGTVPFVLDASTLLVPAAVMVVLGLVGAALSVRRITAVDPLAALGASR
ncbi:ABC transporter permease [Salinifilum ghardaiensis]